MTSDIGDRLVLLSLPGIGPARLRWLLGGGSADDVVRALRDGRLPPVVDQAPAGVTAKLIQQWTHGIRAADREHLLRHNRELGDCIIAPDHVRWPFVDDPDPPALLFGRGRIELLGVEPAVAVIGTRRCSAIGRRVALDLGRQLAEAGVTVVSGLATGIDAAAHHGVVAAGGAPLAVVGTGLDVVYPVANRRLWSEVADQGLIVTEAPRGIRPDRWRFPARNRLIAGLVSVVVVVESHAAGGSLHTVSAAIERGCTVMAVPGSIMSRSSIGSNQLLVDGCAPVTGVDDVLDALGTMRPKPAVQPVARAAAEHGDGGAGSPLSQVILRHVGASALHIDELMTACWATVPEILAAVQELVAADLASLDGSTVSLRQQPPL